MPLSMRGATRCKDTLDGTGSFIWEKGVGGTVDLSKWHTEGKRFASEHDDRLVLKDNVLCSALSS